MTPDAFAEASSTAASGERRSLEPLRALIVDDDEFDRMTVKRMMLSAGFAVKAEECESAAAALRLLETEPFDLVLLDFNLNLPTYDGLYVVRQSRSRGVRVPVVVLTGQDNAEVAVELMKAGASDYLAKSSLSPARLGHALRSVLRIHRLEEEARAAHEALRASEELNHSVLAASADCIKILDVSGRLLSLSQAGQCMLEIEDLAAVVGTDWLDFWKDADRTAAAAALERARAGEPGRFVGHCPSMKGKSLWWDVVLTPIRGADGRPEKILCVSRDVTELKRRESFEQQLVGIVSHDLRNPLNAILVSADVLLRNGGLDERTTKSMNRIRSAGQRAARMIRDLLDFTRARLGGGIPIARAPADLASVCGHVIEEVALAWPDRKVVSTLPARLEACVDADRISQVLTNLLANALQYSPAGTDVTAALSEVGGSAVLDIHNQGAPIPADFLPKLFEPLQRAAATYDRASRSIGLGLYIVKQLVRAHSGSIEVISTAEAGTTFTVRLPLTGMA
ncbi:sensor histidine kinase [Pyxidicoccus trucidator]|uniref:sensor histidine kinase n=1 Tax=Pyxidicoccus trucidator TaxID=2709662 RepID=UPI0013DB84A9|nr:ATP-binding protein [Pyxidicoccus trucidator]